MLLIHRRLRTKSDSVKTARIIHSAQRTFAHCVSFPTLTKPRFTRILSSEATGKHSTCRLSETRRQWWIFELDLLRETCAGGEHKDRLSVHEDHKSSIFEKGVPTSAKEVGNYSRILNICTWSVEDKCVEMVNVHVFVNESSHSSWTTLFGEPGGLQEHELRGNSELIQYGEDVASKRCNYKMGRSSGRIHNVPFSQRNAGNRWGSNWIWVELIPRIFVIEGSFRKSRKICDNGTSNLKNSQIGSSSCQCSTTSIGQKKGNDGICISNSEKSRNTRRDSRRDTGRSSVLEMNRSGMEKQSTLLKESGIQ